ncbi:dipeptidase [Spelaeicoccus albus]|uniref:Membrane dipeptidase n=1 Tax=Spelaeicoccus albus TaxID=1280376 RepID=A0A7Z0IHC6_9MICO|nr:dipeptidase [Spelaeicoccus albus]NYI67655.1 membrane dipeptidase [Spelaeicoccus albus]
MTRLLIDTHNDLPAALREKAGYAVSGLDRVRPELHTDLVKLKAGGLSAQFWSVWVPSDLAEPDAVAATMEQIDAVYRLVAEYPHVFAFAATADQVDNAVAGGRIASLLGIEGGHSIGESLGVLRSFARLGVRYMTVTHNDDTSWAASGTGERQTTGLNAMGIAIVAEMNRIGMMVDISHTAESTQLDALATSRAPVIFSHSSCRAVADHPRNVSDAVLEKMASLGGVQHVTFVPGFVSQPRIDWRLRMLEVRAELGLPGDGASAFAEAPKPGESPADVMVRNDELLGADPDAGRPETARADWARWLEENPAPAATVNDVVRHIEHARDVAGVDHIGLGGDFDGTGELPVGLEDVSCYPAIFTELSARGWSESDLDKLAGVNTLRVMRDIEDAAEDLIVPGFA